MPKLTQLQKVRRKSRLRRIQPDYRSRTGSRNRLGTLHIHLSIQDLNSLHTLAGIDLESVFSKHEACWRRSVLITSNDGG